MSPDVLVSSVTASSSAPALRSASRPRVSAEDGVTLTVLPGASRTDPSTLDSTVTNLFMDSLPEWSQCVEMLHFAPP